MPTHKFDRGWAWAVDGGAFIVLFVLVGWLRVAGLIFVEIQSLTGASTADVAWVAAGNSITWHFIAPVSAILAGRIGTRKVVAIGGMIVSASLCSGFFIRSIQGFIIMGTCVGVGGALCFTPSVVFLSHYFRRRLGIASGITSSGSSFGQIILTPLCGYFLEVYGLPGTLLIYGGISLNLLVTAALFFPVDQADMDVAIKLYQEEQLKGQTPKEDPEEQEMLEQKNDESKQNNVHKDFLEPNSSFNPAVSIHSIHASMTSLHEIKKLHVLKRLTSNPNFWCLLIGQGVGSLTSMALVRYGPAYCMEFDNITLVEVGQLLSYSGMPGIFIRLAIGLVSDFDVIRKKVERYRLFVLGILLTAASCFIFLTTSDFVGFLLNFLLMGVSSGFFFTLNSVSAFDLLGLDNYLVGFGLMNAATGFLFLLDSTVVARLRDITGTFHASFILCGVLALVVSALMLIVVPIGQHYNKRREHSQELRR